MLLAVLHTYIVMPIMPNSLLTYSVFMSTLPKQFPFYPSQPLVCLCAIWPPLKPLLCLSLIHLQSQVGLTEAQTVGATAKRASPRTTRCSLSPASEAAQARPPRDPGPHLQCRPPLHPPKKWIFLASMGRRSTGLRLTLRLLQPPLLTF